MPTWVVMPNAATGKKKVIDGHKRVGDGNPLHRYPRAPFDPEFEPQMDVLFNSAEYLQLSFDAIDQHFGLKCEMPGPYTYWLSQRVMDPPKTAPRINRKPSSLTGEH